MLLNGKIWYTVSYSILPCRVTLGPTVLYFQGLEHVKKVEAQYCELCHRYLPRLDDAERAQAVHCRSSQHLRLYREEQRLVRAQKKAAQEALEKSEKPADEAKQNGVVCFFLSRIPHIP